MKRNIVDNSNFPERKVVKSTATPLNSLAYRMGSRMSLELECGHIVGLKTGKSPTKVKCMKCHEEDRK